MSSKWPLIPRTPNVRFVPIADIREGTVKLVRGGPRLLFEPLEIADQIPDLTGIQSELGHIRVAGDNTFAERLFK